MDNEYDMNNGKTALVITDNSSRFFKGDKVQIIRYIKTNDAYLVKRLEGFIEGEINPKDIQIMEI